MKRKKIDKLLESYFKRNHCQGWNNSYAQKSIDVGNTGIVHHRTDKAVIPIDYQYQKLEQALHQLKEHEILLLLEQYIENGNQSEKAARLKITIHSYQVALCNIRKKISECVGGNN